MIKVRTEHRQPVNNEQIYLYFIHTLSILYPFFIHTYILKEHPLILLHGGPGTICHYVSPFASFSHFVATETM